jgi:plasmid stabilization system protein ParE
MRVVWSEMAELELFEIHDYLAEAASPEAAMRSVEQILSRGERIASFPESGRDQPRCRPHRGAGNLQ